MSDNPNFVATYSSDEVYFGQDLLTCLTDVVEGKADTGHTHSEYAPVNHTHDGYASQSDLELLEDVVDTKANANHTHSEYAPLSHTHTGYATTTELDTLAEEVNGKADIAHTHSEYAPLSHTHDDRYYTETEINSKLAGKADASHTHTGVYDESGAATSALASANAYTDSKINALVGEGASDTLDTIGEISSAIEDNQDAISLLNSAIANKANTSDLTSHVNNTTIHITTTDRNNWDAAKTHANSAHAPSNAEKNQNAFSNVTVGNTTISADTATDTITLVAGTNVTLTPNSESDSITISATNTVYEHPTSAGNKHIPAGGSSGQILRWSADGTAVWGVDNNTTYDNATQTSSGLMSNTDKTKLDGIATNANNYTLPSAGASLGGVKTGGDVTISSGVITVNDDSHNHVISNVNGLQDALNSKAASSHNHNSSYYTQAQVDTKDSSTLTSAKTYANGLNTAMDTRMSDVEDKLSGVASGAEVNQNAFSNVVIGNTTIAADAKTDSLTIASGTGISVAGDATNDKVTITNSGVRSISTGSTNGTISVNTNGTTTNVAVKGLGSAAYTSSTAYDAAGVAQAKANEALASAKTYADGIKNDLLNGAGEAYDTLKELGDLIDVNADAIDALETVAANKANASDLTSHTSNKSNPHNVTLAQLGVTATASELNKMDGVTATTAELNIMDGVTATTAEINYVDGVTSNIQTQLNGKASSSHTHNYAGSSSAGGAATSADKLNANAGSATNPVYFSNGVPVKTTYTLGKSVPSNAVFTDTTYSAASTTTTGLMSASDKSKLDGIASGANAYTLPAAGSALGGVKSGGDVTISSGTITVNDDSHNHVIANVDGLQTALNEKASSSHNHNSSYVAKSLQITSDTGDVEVSWSDKDVVAQIKALGSGVHTAYAKSGTTNNPKTIEAWRFMIHKTGSANYGWVMAFGSYGSVYTGYVDNGTWKGWRCVFDADPAPLWQGAMYMSSPNSTPQTVTPSKKLSECRNGWLLLWSDYDKDTKKANDSDFVTTMIPKSNPTGGNWGGKAFYCDIPRYIGSDVSDVDTERRIIKSIYIHDNCIKGSYNNDKDERNDVVLRAVYEY